jgi:hypothetical protein
MPASAAWASMSKVTMPGPHALSWMIDEVVIGRKRGRIWWKSSTVTPALCFMYCEAPSLKTLSKNCSTSGGCDCGILYNKITGAVGILMYCWIIWRDDSKYGDDRQLML